MRGKASATAKKLGFVAASPLRYDLLAHYHSAAGKPHRYECEYAGGYVKKVFFEQSRSTLRCLRTGFALKMRCTLGASAMYCGRGYLMYYITLRYDVEKGIFIDCDESG